MTIAKKTGLVALLTAIGVFSFPQSTNGVGQFSSDLVEQSQPRITTKSTIDYIVSKIKEYNKVNSSFIPGQDYTAEGYNDQLGSRVNFIYVESGGNAVLRTVLIDKPYSRIAQAIVTDEKTENGMAYVTLIEHLIRGQPNSEPTTMERLVMGEKAAEIELSRFLARPGSVVKRTKIREDRGDRKTGFFLRLPHKRR